MYSCKPETERPGRDLADQSIPGLRPGATRRTLSPAWSSKLMVVGDSMGHGLQLVGALFLNFLLGKLSREFKLHEISILHEF